MEEQCQVTTQMRHYAVHRILHRQDRYQQAIQVKRSVALAVAIGTVLGIAVPLAMELQRQQETVPTRQAERIRLPLNCLLARVWSHPCLCIEHHVSKV
jgi:hypothetical protein